MYRCLLCLLFSVFSSVSPTIFFEENFNDAGWTERWTRTERQEFRGKPFGHFNWTAGKWYYDEADKGIRMMDDESYYAISTKFPRFSNLNSNLVVQFSVKFERKADMGDDKHYASAFIKLLPSNHNPKFFDNNSKYLMKFGPDTVAHKVESTIFYRGKNWDFNRRMDFGPEYIYLPGPFLPEDPHTHLYTFIIYPNNTFVKRVDGRVIVEESGHFEQCWQTHPERRIQVNSKAERPADWDEREYILDPTDTKPADWDQPEEIPDPHATRPDDWNDEEDGPWQHPRIRNPAFKGDWQPSRLLPNPHNQGPWRAEMMDNPEYVPDPTMYIVKDIGAIGIEGWQQQAGTVIDSILVTDDVDLALARGLPVQQKANEAETRLFRERCERERLVRVKEMEKIAADKRRMKKLMKAAQRRQHEHDEL